jgi:2'-5' RNA ligase
MFVPHAHTSVRISSGGTARDPPSKHATMQWHPLRLQPTAPSPIRQGGTDYDAAMDRAFIKDLRHRYSYELRPDAALDAAVRALATELEAAGLLEPGAATAPRFHPHLTCCRAAVLVPDAVDAAARRLARDGTAVVFDELVTFGDGRIACLVPSERAVLDAVRAEVLDRISPDQLDPTATSRPWTPHVTVAYSVPEPSRDEVLAQLEAALPLTGSWERCQAWDLDVRPTRLERDVRCVLDHADG